MNSAVIASAQYKPKNTDLEFSPTAELAFDNFSLKLLIWGPKSKRFGWQKPKETYQSDRKNFRNGQIPKQFLKRIKKKKDQRRLEWMDGWL